MSFEVVGKYAPVHEINPIDKMEADALDRDGIVQSGMSKLATEWIERMYHLPSTTLETPMPKSGWRLITEAIKKDAASWPIHTDLYQQAMIAADTASKVPHATKVFDAMTAQYELCMELFGEPKPIAQLMLRHHAYLVVQREFAGRNVG